MGELGIEFGTVNYVVVVVYLAAMLGIGYWAKRRVTSSRGFFTAEGRLPPLLVGLALLATYLSALTMMALPRASFGNDDWLWAIQLPFLVVTALVITSYVLPRYREAGVVSVYEFLEQRIHISSRLLASACFVIFAMARGGLLLYLPALAISVVIGTPLVPTIIVIGLVMIVYTAWGGIEAVSWTDAIQALLFIAAAVVTVAYILVMCGSDFGRVAVEHHKFRIWEGSMDVSRIASVWLILQTLVETIRIYATQQDMTQRYLTTGSTAKANRSVWIAILGYIPLGFMFYFIGSGLFIYYQIHPDDRLPRLMEHHADALYPFFVVTRLPAGLPGLVIAGIWAAAMSSVAALLNSSAAVCTEDFYKRFARVEHDDAHYLAVGRALTVVWGLVAIGIAISLTYTQEMALAIWQKIMAIAMNGILGLMALAFLPRRVRPAAAVIGFATAYLVLFWLMWGPQEWLLGLSADGTARRIHFLLWPVITNLVCFAVAVVADAVAGDGLDSESAV